MKGKKYAELSLNFLKITKFTLEENIKRGNLNYFSASNLSEEEFTKQMDDNMKYNDNNIGIALFFNFYHGLELCFKTISKINHDNVVKNHGLIKLYNEIEEFLEDSDVKNIFENYLLIKKDKNLDLINNFFINNKANVDNFYILLKYPEGKTEFNYDTITWQEEKIIPLYKKMVSDIEILIRYLVSYTKKNP